MQHVIGIGEMQVSTRREDTIITYSLGSCVGLTLYDPVACVGGMIHCMLPLSKIDPAKAKINPMMYTDTGVTAFLQDALAKGAVKSRLIANIAGCSRMLDQNGHFKIGDRNYTICRKVLWKNNVLIASENVGGTIPRTMTLHLDTGRTMLRSRGKEIEL